MTDFPILRDLGAIVVAAAICVLIARRAKVPAIVAFMLAGLVLGPGTGLVHVTEPVELIAEVGIALLLFLVGLELSVATVRDVGKVALIAGGGQVLLTAGGGLALALVLGFDARQAAVLAACLTFSSTVVAVKMCAEQRELASLHGRIAVGVLLVQDLVAVLVITLLSGLGRPGDAAQGEIWESILLAFAGVAALGLAALLIAAYGLRRFLSGSRTSAEAGLVWSLAWCFVFIVAAEWLGLSVEIGAFIAGVALAQLAQSHELRRRVEPLVDFFIAVFFVTLGIHMQPAAAAGLWAAGLAFMIFVLLFKPAMLLALVPRLGYGERTAFYTAVTLAQVSEFSLIIAALAARDGVIGPDVLSLIGVLGLVTIGVSSFAIRSKHRLYGRASRSGILRPFGAAAEASPSAAPRRTGHIIVVGMNTLGRRLVDALAERGERVLAIDTDPAKLAALPAETLTGNAELPGVLEEANLATAKLLVSTLQIEDANNLLAFRAREAGVPASIHAFDPSLTDELKLLGADHLMVSKHDGIRQVAAALRVAGMID